MRKRRIVKERSGRGGSTRGRREGRRQEEAKNKGWKVSREGYREEGSLGRRVEVEVKRRKDIAPRGESVWREDKNISRRAEGRKQKYVGVRKRREKVEKGGRGRRKKKEADKWEEEIVRVGTGYRVRRGDAPGRRKFDVGYGDRKPYKIPMGVEVELGKTNTSRKVKSEGKGARERVMKVVCTRERIRKRSVYTGCGRSRKSRVGKKKLKPTKVRTR